MMAGISLTWPTRHSLVEFDETYFFFAILWHGQMRRLLVLGYLQKKKKQILSFSLLSATLTPVFAAPTLTPQTARSTVMSAGGWRC